MKPPILTLLIFASYGCCTLNAMDNRTPAGIEDFIEKITTIRRALVDGELTREQVDTCLVELEEDACTLMLAAHHSDAALRRREVDTFNLLVQKIIEQRTCLVVAPPRSEKPPRRIKGAILNTLEGCIFVLIILELWAYFRTMFYIFANADALATKTNKALFDLFWALYEEKSPLEMSKALKILFVVGGTITLYYRA